MSQTQTKPETADRIVAGPYTTRSNANRAMKKLTASNPGRNLYVSDEGTGGEEYRIFERVVDAAEEYPNGTPALDMDSSARIKAGLRGDLALNKDGVLVVDRKPEESVEDEAPKKARKSRKAAAPAETPAPAEAPASEPTIPDGAVEPNKKVRCGAGTVTYTHQKKDGSAFVFGRWIAENGDVVTFARGAGWWKNGRKVDAKTLAGAFEA